MKNNQASSSMQLLKNTLLLFIILYLNLTKGYSQSVNNRHASISKKEFNELVTHWAEFIPADIKQNKVIIIRYTTDELEHNQYKARFECLNEEINISEKDKERGKKALTETARKYPDDLKKALAMNGINSIIKTESELSTIDASEYRYVLKPIYVCSATKRMWTMTMSQFFTDRLQSHNFQLFLPINHNTLDLLKAIH